MTKERLHPLGMTKVENTPAFLIHRRMYQGSSLLLDFFTKDFGRLRLIARGARNSKTSLQMFQCLSISFKGRGDLKSLSQWEIADQPRRLQGDDLILAMYANELILRLVPESDPNGNIFKSYWVLLENLLNLDSNELRILKTMNRKRLKSLLGDKPLKSKELFFVK